jgi:hypothetical protein
MRLVALILTCALLSSCSADPKDSRSACTEETVGRDLGAEIVTLTLLVPDHFMTGAEISNGGIAALSAKCDFALNAFFSNETADQVIRKAAAYPLKHRDLFRVAEAEMLIWKFSDGSGEQRFFVMSLMDMRPAQNLPAWLDKPAKR